jgi:hypothetical protein
MKKERKKERKEGRKEMFYNRCNGNSLLLLLNVGSEIFSTPLTGLHCLCGINWLLVVC